MKSVNWNQTEHNGQRSRWFINNTPMIEWDSGPIIKRLWHFIEDSNRVHWFISETLWNMSNCTSLNHVLNIRAKFSYWQENCSLQRFNNTRYVVCSKCDNGDWHCSRDRCMSGQRKLFHNYSANPTPNAFACIAVFFKYITAQLCGTGHANYSPPVWLK